MQIKIVTIPLLDSSVAEAELNRFLRSHRILQVDKGFIPEDNGCWSVFVTYMDGDSQDTVSTAHRSREKEDITKDLTDEQRARFESFRAIRLDLAKKNNVRAYMIFTDKELISMATTENLSIEAIANIKGVGEKRASQYGDFFFRRKTFLVKTKT